MSTPRRPLPGVAYVLAKVYGLSDQKEFSNLFWFSVNSGTVVPDLDTTLAGTAIYNALAGPWLSCLADDTILRGINTELSDGNVAISGDYYSEQNGLQSSDTLPGDVAAVVQKITAQPGKPGRGRWYFSEVPNILSLGSYLNAGGITAYEAFAVILKGTITYTGTSGAVVLSPCHFSVKNRALYPITNDPIVPLLGTKRRRRGVF